MLTTNIEWTDSTWNPWIGCTQVSQGCVHCYAESLMSARYGRVQWGTGQQRSRTKTWEEPAKWDKTEKEGHRVFVASLSDVFDAEVPPAWLGEVMDTMKPCKHLRFLLLTKRIEEAAKRLPSLVAERGGWGEFRHLALGCTAEDQEHWDSRVPVLLGVAGGLKTFVSVEPMLGPVDPRGLRPDWIIVGGESGHGCRPMDPSWPRPLRDWAVQSGIPFFFKQWGGVHKRKNGKILDGREWCQVLEF